jgi:hypothetical protein
MTTVTSWMSVMVILSAVGVMAGGALDAGAGAGGTVGSKLSVDN